MSIIFVIEYAQLKVFKRFWLECDFFLLCQAFGSFLRLLNIYSLSV